jgi:hypothetical protein
MSIVFGDYYSCYYIVNWFYDNVCEKILNLAIQAGPDRYNRNFNAEPLINFAITNSITDKSADYIYRHFVYDKIEQKMSESGILFDKDEAEITDNLRSFTIV